LEKFLELIRPQANLVANESGSQDYFQKVQFYEQMSSVTLPVITGSEEQRAAKLREIFTWLRRKHVKVIRELRIPDSGGTPYSEADVADCLHDFVEVRELNWMRLDMSLDVLPRPAPAGNGNENPSLPQMDAGPLELQKTIKGVRNLCLYTANWGMISHWTGNEGLRAYPEASCTPIFPPTLTGVAVANFDVAKDTFGNDSDCQGKLI
jgi:hypothetical protein